MVIHFLLKGRCLYIKSYRKGNIIDEKVSQGVWNFFIKDTSNSKSKFEERPGQQNMALDIADAIRDDEHIMIEAGVGIGKSYAYLVPLMLYNKTFDDPVIISTSTIALQEQLISDIDRISNELEYFPEVVLAKGMSHFICLTRALEYFNTTSNSEKYSLLKDSIFINDIGDRTHFPKNIEEHVWNRINVKDCTYQRCVHFKTCHFIQRRAKMNNTCGLILCNHDLLIVDAIRKERKIRPLLSKNVKLITMDESHNLEEKVRSCLEVSLTYNGLESHIRKAISLLSKSNSFGDYYKMERDMLSLGKKIFSDLSKQINTQIKGTTSNMERFHINIIKIHTNVLELSNSIKDLNISVQLIDDSRFEDLQEDIFEDLSKLESFLKEITSSNTNLLLWTELRNKRNEYYDISIKGCPRELDKEISKLFFSSSKPKTILTSATLTSSSKGSNEERYSYVTKNIGFPIRGQSFLSDPQDSSYSYNENGIVYFKEDMPHPTRNHDEYIDKCMESIVELINITKGKTLILFTSKDDLNEIYSRLLKLNLNYKILKQQDGSSQESVINEFKNNINSVLLGAGAFWEGFNVEGKALSNVIIFRLPFPVPDPIIEYKRSLSSKPLLEVDVPEMLTKLRQGTGRLIRNNTDKGIISILDSRIGNNSNSIYKDKVWDSILIKTKTSNIDDIKNFTKKILNI